jgi:hypothetical protein
MNDDEFRHALATLASTRPAVGPSEARAAVGTRAARYRRRRRAVTATIGAAAAGIVVAAAVTLTGLHHQESVTVRGDGATGIAVGHIDACSGLPQPQRFVDGTVVARRGHIRFKRLGAGVSKQVLPRDVVARQVVPIGGEYRFTLPAGAYVIDVSHGHDTASPNSDVSVVVRSHQTVLPISPTNANKRHKG